MADLTIEQRKALALAAARMRLQQQQPLPEPKNQSRLGMVEEAMLEGQPMNIGAKGDMRAGDRVQPDLATSAARGATFNLGDEAVAGMMTPIEMLAGGHGASDAYSNIRARQNAQQAATRDKYPKGDVAAELAGGLASTPKLIGKALEGGTVAEKAMRGFATGGAMGGASAFGSGGESLEDRLNATETGVLTGAGIGTALPGAGALAGKIGQSVSKLGQRASEFGEFGSDKLRAASEAAYEAADKGVGKVRTAIGPNGHLMRLSRSFNETAKNKGLGGAFSEVIAPDFPKSSQRLAAFNKIADDVSKGLRPPPTFGEIERLRQGLRKAVTESVTPQGNLTKDGELASEFIDKIDEMIDATPFKDARAAYRLLRKTEIIEDAFNAAKNATGSNYTQAGFETAIRQQFRKIAQSKNFNATFTKAEREAIMAVVRPGKLEKSLKRLGFLAPRGGISTMFTAGMTIANPFIGVPMAAAGLAGKYGSTAMALGNAQKAGRMVANGGTMPPQLPPPPQSNRFQAPFGLIPYFAGQ